MIFLKILQANLQMQFTSADNPSSDPEGSRYFRGEIDVTGGINQINQKLASLSLLGNVLALLFRSWACREIATDLIVIQRSCSSGRVPMNFFSPALATDIIPAPWIGQSVKVDFRWSTILSLDFTYLFLQLSGQFRTVCKDGRVTEVCNMIHQLRDLISES